jgi:dihydrofolate synthase/folylpolyglutamate synthase
MTSFEKFINKKPMSYKKIDLQRMPDAFNIIEESFDIPKIIHIVGTNGKGTTGRFIAEILLKNGFRVGHYTSPHILEINERFWKNGKYVSDNKLEQA